MSTKQLEQAVKQVAKQHGLHAEITQKRFPAEGVVYVRLFDDDGHEEWSLIDPSRNYDTAFLALQRSAIRMERGGDFGF